MDFKESPFMYGIAFVVIGFVIVQSVFFIVKAWKRAKELGIKQETLKQTVTSSALFTLAPALAILATVIVLASSLGIVLPWIRLSVVGNLAYETVAEQTVLDELGGSLDAPVTDVIDFASIAWVMTLGSIMPLILIPIFLKKIQKGIGKATSKDSKWSGVMSAAAFIGLIAAFVDKPVEHGVYIRACHACQKSRVEIIKIDFLQWCPGLEFQLFVNTEKQLQIRQIILNGRCGSSLNHRFIHGKLLKQGRIYRHVNRMVIRHVKRLLYRSFHIRNGNRFFVLQYYYNKRVYKNQVFC